MATMSKTELEQRRERVHDAMRDLLPRIGSDAWAAHHREMVMEAARLYEELDTVNRHLREIEEHG